MGLYYQTEYSLDRRRGRVCRSYTGLPAFLAITIDLLFLVTFELAFAVLFFSLKCVAMVLRASFYVLTLPFQAIQWLSRTVEQRAAAGTSTRARAHLKPAWAGSREV